VEHSRVLWLLPGTRGWRGNDHQRWKVEENVRLLGTCWRGRGNEDGRKKEEIGFLYICQRK
jgi:hypothetical protein